MEHHNPRPLGLGLDGSSLGTHDGLGKDLVNTYHLQNLWVKFGSPSSISGTTYSRIKCHLNLKCPVGSASGLRVHNGSLLKFPISRTVRDYDG